MRIAFSKPMSEFVQIGIPQTGLNKKGLSAGIRENIQISMIQ
jgi:hypothetical protein